MVEILFIYLEKVVRLGGQDNKDNDQESSHDWDNFANEVLKTFNYNLFHPHILNKIYESNVMQWLQQLYNKIDFRFYKTH